MWSTAIIVAKALPPLELRCVTYKLPNRHRAALQKKCVALGKKSNLPAVWLANCLCLFIGFEILPYPQT